MIDWCCSEEGEMTIMVGLKDEAWTYDENGGIKVLLKPDAEGKYQSCQDLVRLLSGVPLAGRHRGRLQLHQPGI